VTATVCSCLATLRQISSIRHSLSRPALLTLIRALVISKLDYCCSSSVYACWRTTVCMAQRQATLPALRPVSGLATQRHLRSADTATLLVPTTRHSTLGDRAFPAAAARAWNSLPCHVRDMPSLLAFSRELKTVLFRLSYPVDWQL